MSGKQEPETSKSPEITFFTRARNEESLPFIGS